MKTRIITDEELKKLGGDPEKYSRVFYYWDEKFVLDVYECYDEICNPLPETVKAEFYQYVLDELERKYKYKATISMDEIAREFAIENRENVDKARRNKMLKENLEKRLGGVK